MVVKASGSGLTSKVSVSCPANTGGTRTRRVISAAAICNCVCRRNVTTCHWVNGTTRVPRMRICSNGHQTVSEAALVNGKHAFRRGECPCGIGGPRFVEPRRVSHQGPSYSAEE